MIHRCTADFCVVFMYTLNSFKLALCANFSAVFYINRAYRKRLLFRSHYSIKVKIFLFRSIHECFQVV